MRTTIVVAGLLAAACGKHDDAASKATSAPAGALSPAGSAVEASSGGGADDSACKLISQDEAGKLLGHAAKPGEMRKTGPVPSCHFRPDGASGSLTLQYFERGEANYDQIRGMMLKSPIEIAGVGTKAARDTNGSVFMVLANGHLAVVVSMIAAKERPQPNVVEDFAKTLAGRL
jgi:hypothetical protein